MNGSSPFGFLAGATPLSPLLDCNSLTIGLSVVALFFPDCPSSTFMLVAVVVAVVLAAAAVVTAAIVVAGKLIFFSVDNKSADRLGRREAEGAAVLLGVDVIAAGIETGWGTEVAGGGGGGGGATGGCGGITGRGTRGGAEKRRADWAARELASAVL